MEAKPCEQCGTPIPSGKLGPKRLAHRRFCNQTCESDWFEAKVPARFWEKVQKGPSCWEWTGCRMKSGYGRTTRRGQEWYTHRLSWEMTNGPIPKGLNVMHICDNPPCVRPDHLALGTWAANMNDKVRKGRHVWPGHRGSKVGTAKLTEAKVLLMRQMHAEGESIHSLSRRFGVSRPTVRRALDYLTWRHVEAA